MILNKLELDIMQANELREGVELAYKYNFPSVVIHPNLITDALRARGAVRGRFKIIVPVDWPKGDNFGTVKFRGLLTDAIEADGFEVMMTAGKNENDTRNEAKAITDFVKRHIAEQTEVRFVLGTYARSEEAITNLCQGLLHVRTPSMVRLDTQLKLQVSKANTEEHLKWLNLIRGIISAPIKVVGNVGGVRAVTGCNAACYGVNLLQARTIIKEFQQQPNSLKALLNTQAEETNNVPDEL